MHGHRSWLPGCAAEQGVKGGEELRGEGGEAGGEIHEGVGGHSGRRFGPVFDPDVGFDVALRLTPPLSRR